MDPMTDEETMDCASSTALLSAHLDGELAANEADRVRRHLATCDSCRARYALLLGLREYVRSLPREIVSPQFGPALRRRLPAEVSLRQRLPRRWLLLASGLAVAAALVLLVVGGFRGSGSSPRSRRSASVPRHLTAADAGTDMTVHLLSGTTPCASTADCGTH
jgi:anti-sigma factor RsiW